MHLLLMWFSTKPTFTSWALPNQQISWSLTHVLSHNLSLQNKFGKIQYYLKELYKAQNSIQLKFTNLFKETQTPLTYLT